MASLLICGSPLPVGGAWTELHGAFSDAVDSANTLRPAGARRRAAGRTRCSSLGGLACLLLVDLLACTLRRVPLAGLPLLTIYSVPVSMIGDGRSPGGSSPLTAVGFLAMLFLQESEQSRRWGRPLGEDRETGDPIAFGAGTGAVRGTAGAIGGVATAARDRRARC